MIFGLNKNTIQYNTILQQNLSQRQPGHNENLSTTEKIWGTEDPKVPRILTSNTRIKRNLLGTVNISVLCVSIIGMFKCSTFYFRLETP
jgi:hypothetical protein